MGGGTVRAGQSKWRGAAYVGVGIRVRGGTVRVGQSKWRGVAYVGVGPATPFFIHPKTDHPNIKDLGSSVRARARVRVCGLQVFCLLQLLGFDLREEASSERVNG